MKKVLKITGFFLLLFVANIPTSNAQRVLGATEGETVTFDLIGVFEDGDGMDKIVEIWLIDPFFVKTDLTWIARHVLLNVQVEQAGPYRFYIRRADGRIEMQVINLTVRLAQSFACFYDSLDSRWKNAKQFDFYLKRIS